MHIASWLLFLPTNWQMTPSEALECQQWEYRSGFYWQKLEALAETKRATPHLPPPQLRSSSWCSLSVAFGETVVGGKLVSQRSTPAWGSVLLSLCSLLKFHLWFYWNIPLNIFPFNMKSTSLIRRHVLTGTCEDFLSIFYLAESEEK